MSQSNTNFHEVCMCIKRKLGGMHAGIKYQRELSCTNRQGAGSQSVRAQNYLIHLSHFNKSKISLNRFNSQTNTKIGLTKTKTPGFESFDIKALKDCQERLIRLFPDSLQVTSRN